MKPIFYQRLGIFFWFLTAVFAILPSWPYIYYRLSPGTSDALASTIASTTSTDTPNPIEKPSSTPTPSPSTTSLPPLDPSLPKENGLIIDKIGVRGEIHEGDDWQKILKEGIWRVPNFATPLEVLPVKGESGVAEGGSKPIILAAHRWGYLDWSASFRKLNSFYNLPKLKEGDKIEIIWEQRKYQYEVTSVSTGTEIPDYNADLILYTCQLWNSPVRFFILAKRIN